MENRTAIIDADVLVYRCGFAGQDSVHSVIVNGDVLEQFASKAEANDFCELLALQGAISPHIETEIVPKSHSEVETILDVMVHNIVEQSGSTDYICYLSGKTNFRLDAAKYTDYKANRKDGVKPLHYDYIREYIQEKHPVILSDNCEADDLCAMRLFSAFNKYVDNQSSNKLDCDQILCSIDKDLLNVPGWHYNISSREIMWQEPNDADRHFASQLLTGDRVDNIPGISFYSDSKKKVGPSTARKILGDAVTKEELYQAVCDAYEEFAGEDWHDKLNNTGLLLWMMRKPEQHFDIEEWKGGVYD